MPHPLTGRMTDREREQHPDRCAPMMYLIRQAKRGDRKPVALRSDGVAFGHIVKSIDGRWGWHGYDPGAKRGFAKSMRAAAYALWRAVYPPVTPEERPIGKGARWWMCARCRVPIQGDVGSCKGYCQDESGRSCDSVPCPKCGNLHYWTSTLPKET